MTKANAHYPLGVLFAVFFLFISGTAWADQLVLVDGNELTVGPVGAETTIQWDSSFEDLNFDVDVFPANVINLTVYWDVVAGVAEYQAFVKKPKGFTPKDVEGWFEGISPPPGTAPETSADGVLGFTVLKGTGGGKKGLAFDPVTGPAKSKGSGHLYLMMKVDSTGDGEADLDVALGVNVHVCDNGDPYVPCPTE